MRRAWLFGLVALAACRSAPVALPTAVEAVVDAGAKSKWMTTGDDPWEVFVCHVPLDTQSPVYAGLPLRRPLEPDAVASILDEKVTAYFATLSNGDYRPSFTSGGDVAISATDEPQACVDKAIAASDTQAHGVIAIADAEHNAGKPGGFGNPGTVCASPPCPASTTRRSAYVGASDFSPDWGDNPPMDLIEHEIGHTLGWPHSGYDASLPEPTQSALDVMSNSAAPREVLPDRRDAPDTLAVNRLSAGWLPTSSVAVVATTGTTVMLAPSNGQPEKSAKRLAVIALDDHRFITVELLTNEGFDSHLPATGVAVHLVDETSEPRTQTPLIGLAPYNDLLGRGETLTTNGWRIAVGDGWSVKM
ncbi:MAG TPA: hypothetical protein VIH06_12010, partial [Ilumatobacteraceae bacterium]